MKAHRKECVNTFLLRRRYYQLNLVFISLQRLIQTECRKNPLCISDKAEDLKHGKRENSGTVLITREYIILK